ncbi:MAG: NACHT domain-containing protein, partial [Vitreimonas sp.]
MNQELEKTIADNIGVVVKDIYAGTKAFVGRNAAAFQNEIESGFKKLVVESYQRRSMIKTLLDGNEPVPLRDYYVPVRLSLNEKNVSEARFISNYAKQRRIMIIGTAGAGKSMFMKRLFLSAVEAPKEPIPLFIELRGINDTTFSLFDLILDSVTNYIPKFSAERLKDALHRGKFCLFLDGIDEVDPSKHADVCRQLIELTQKNRSLSV